MRFLVDESRGPAVARWFVEQGHDVVSVYSQMRGANDDHVIQFAIEQERILITNDKDFGDLIFRQTRIHKGVILLRLEDERTENKIRALERLLGDFSTQIGENFVVVGKKGIRISKRS